MTTETSTEVRAQLQEIRDRAAELRTEQEQVLAAGQAEADRLRAEADQVLAEARNRAAKLNSEASNTERSADPVEKRAVLLEAAEMLADGIPAGEERVSALYDEVEALGEVIASVETRLAKLGQDREQVGIELAKARDAGDVDEVTRLRIRLSAVDEVTGALTGQKQTAERRVVAIGAPSGDGELGQAEELVTRMLAEQRRVLNQLDPERPEAQADALLAQLQDYAAAYASGVEEQKALDARPRKIVIQ